MDADGVPSATGGVRSAQVTYRKGYRYDIYPNACPRSPCRRREGCPLRARVDRRIPAPRRGCRGTGRNRWQDGRIGARRRVAAWRTAPVRPTPPCGGQGCEDHPEESLPRHRHRWRHGEGRQGGRRLRAPRGDFPPSRGSPAIGGSDQWVPRRGAQPRHACHACRGNRCRGIGRPLDRRRRTPSDHGRFHGIRCRRRPHAHEPARTGRQYL